MVGKAWQWEGEVAVCIASIIRKLRETKAGNRCLFIQSKTPVHGVSLSMVRMGLPTSCHIEIFVSMVILDSVNSTRDITITDGYYQKDKRWQILIWMEREALALRYWWDTDWLCYCEKSLWALLKNLKMELPQTAVLLLVDTWLKMVSFLHKNICTLHSYSHSQDLDTICVC